MPTQCNLFFAVLFIGISCIDPKETFEADAPNEDDRKFVNEIWGISLPPGFNYVNEGDSAWSQWLLSLKAKENKSVYLYNGSLKDNQDAQYCVLDIDIGKKDLIQCADAAMKLRGDFLFEAQRYADIRFTATSGDQISFDSWLKGVRWKEQRNNLVAYTIIKKMIDIKKEYSLFM